MKNKKFKKAKIQTNLSQNAEHALNESAMAEQVKAHKISYTLMPECFPYVYPVHYLEETTEQEITK